MIDRRALLAGGAALATARPARAAPNVSAKRLAIDSITLPPSFNGVLAYGQIGRIENTRCVGEADIEAGLPVTAATRFKWGSAASIVL